MTSVETSSAVTTDESRLLAAIDREAEAALAFLADLVRVPSDNPPGDCAPFGEAAARALEGLGLTVERHPVAGETCRAHGMVSATNLIVRHRFGDGPVVALNAHGDVVPPGEGWSRDPYGAEIVDGWMIGRGVAVSKSDIATYAFALKALAASGLPLQGTIELHVTADEEAGGEIGPALLLSQGLTKPDYAICAGFSYEVVTAHNGCLHLGMEVRGKSAHAARPETGHDALRAANALLTRLYAHADDLAGRRSSVAGIKGPSCVVGLVSGGINTNVVPDKVALRLDRRIVPDEDAAVAEADLRAIAAEVAASHEGISVEVTRILLARPFGPVEGSDRLASIVAARASAVMGAAVATNGVPLYADARHYSEAGIPTIMYGCGPRTLLEANAHRADERIPVDHLAKATKVIALALRDLLSV
ncbi:M20/M25/M40 family metallo-hydrolase [Enterovirga rhinocerotis]|uniref:Acetylornithine deacetylase/succinyl-diaminopimelate desuccinylase-like protein n=1 Tax=Enterovirga rhinocerotis TaxID=1339210 RepID=A0A4R7BXL6_9HYPH|nr:M20/M25/M40 family metallo-hydrolase [Enterovirga rhinocerotis]TDR89972.1 acetylornithine deacetylase/succinyl-diaminopimelate desuccinylase-like protein [Enterovirga rhinocerotis]